MKTIIICPTYNEIDNISELITRITNLPIEVDCLIIDDNSPDGTSEFVRKIMKKKKNIYLIERERKLGLGTAYCKGFKWALKRNYDNIIQMDADLSHNPNDIIRMIREIDTYDLIIGSRYIEGVNVINWPMSRLILSYCANIYSKFIIRFPIKDSTGGFKCFNRKVLSSIDFDKITSEGYSFQIEMNFLVWKNGFSIKEIPIIFTDRTVGKSKMNRSIIIEAIWIVPKLFIKKIFKII